MAELEEEKRSKAVGWSDLPPDLLVEIFRVLDVVDYSRCLSVCASWRSIPQKTMNFCKPQRGRQLPWMLIKSRSDDPPSTCFYSPSCINTKTAKYTLRLPQVAHGGCIGSSQGFLITVDDRSLKLCAMNPLTGACFPLPPTASHPDIILYDDSRHDAPPLLNIPDGHTRVLPWYNKAVISPSLDTIAVAMEGEAYTVTTANRIDFYTLAYARAGDDSWTALVPPYTWRRLNATSDFIFHKGCLYVIYEDGYLVVFNLENPAALPLASDMMGLTAWESLLTETPDGDDLLLLWRNSTSMRVFRLDKDALEWNRVLSIGDVALFVDRTHLSSLSTRGFPCLKSNCIYFTADVNQHHDNIHLGVYSLEDGSVSRGDDVGKLYWPLPIWFTPAL